MEKQKKVDKDKNNEENKKKRKWLILLILLLLIFLLGYFVFKYSHDYGENNKPTPVSPTPEKLLIEISDEGGNWTEKSNLDIFVLNDEREYIAPYDSGEYEFEVKNTKNKEITYNLSIEENNEYNVNIKYKLKKNGIYLIDTWSNYAELNFNDVLLDKKSIDTYILEWCWVSEDNEADTKIGYLKNRANYSINIKIVAIDGK